MSYCTWSSEKFTSDIYCYADTGGGWTTHVANSRLDERGTGAGVLPRAKPIGGPHDGQTFKDPTLQALLERVAGLRKEGYRVPDYVLKRVEEEIARDRALAGT